MPASPRLFFFLTAVLLFSITIVCKMGWSMNKMAYYWQHAAGVIFQLKKSLLSIWKNCPVCAQLWQCYQAAPSSEILFHRRQQSLVVGGRTSLISRANHFGRHGRLELVWKLSTGTHGFRGLEVFFPANTKLVMNVLLRHFQMSAVLYRCATNAF